MLFIFVKDHCLLKNDYTLNSVSTASPPWEDLVALAAADGHQPPKVGVFISRGWGAP